MKCTARATANRREDLSTIRLQCKGIRLGDNLVVWTARPWVCQNRLGRCRTVNRTQTDTMQQCRGVAGARQVSSIDCTDGQGHGKLLK